MTQTVVIAKINDEVLNFLTEKNLLKIVDGKFKAKKNVKLIYVGPTVEFSTEEELFFNFPLQHYAIKKYKALHIMCESLNLTFVDSVFSPIFSNIGLGLTKNHFFTLKLANILGNEDKVKDFLKDIKSRDDYQLNELCNLVNECCRILYLQNPVSNIEIHATTFYKYIRKFLKNPNDDKLNEIAVFYENSNTILYDDEGGEGDEGDKRSLPFIHSSKDEVTLYSHNIPSIQFYKAHSAVLNDERQIIDQMFDLKSYDSEIVRRFEPICVLFPELKQYSLDYFNQIFGEFSMINDEREITIFCGESLFTDCGYIYKNKNIKVVFLGTCRVESKLPYTNEPFCVNINGVNHGIIQSGHSFEYERSSLYVSGENKMLCSFTTEAGVNFIYHNKKLMRKNGKTTNKFPKFELSKLSDVNLDFSFINAPMKTKKMKHNSDSSGESSDEESAHSSPKSAHSSPKSAHSSPKSAHSSPSFPEYKSPSSPKIVRHISENSSDDESKSAHSSPKSAHSSPKSAHSSPKLASPKSAHSSHKASPKSAHSSHKASPKNKDSDSEDENVYIADSQQISDTEEEIIEELESLLRKKE